MRNLIYFIKEAFRGFYQAKLMTFVSIVTIGASLFFMGVIVIGFMNIDTLLRRAADQADMVAYLEDSIVGDTIKLDSLAAQIGSIQQVQQSVLVDKAAAWEKFETLYGGDLLAAVDDNPLPASFEIYLTNEHQAEGAIAALQQQIQSFEGIEAVRYSRDLVNLGRFRFMFFIVSAALGIILILALHLMISNTIKLTIYARKELVRNMHLVGATDFFIKMPFILEGVLQGSLGSILALSALLFARISLSRFGIFWGPPHLIALMGAGVLLTGVVFGWLGSFSAVRKFLV